MNVFCTFFKKQTGNKKFAGKQKTDKSINNQQIEVAKTSAINSTFASPITFAALKKWGNSQMLCNCHK